MVGLLRHKPKTVNIHDYCASLASRYGRLHPRSSEPTPAALLEQGKQPDHTPPASDQGHEQIEPNVKAKRKKPNGKKRQNQNSKTDVSSRLKVSHNELEQLGSSAKTATLPLESVNDLDDDPDPVPNDVFFRAMDILAKERDVSVDDAKHLYKLGSCRANLRQRTSTAANGAGPATPPYPVAQSIRILGKILDSIVQVISSPESSMRPESRPTQQQDLLTRLEALQVAIFGLLDVVEDSNRVNGREGACGEQDLGTRLASSIVQPTMAAFKTVSLAAVSRLSHSGSQHNLGSSLLSLLYGIIAVLLEHPQSSESATLWTVASVAASSGIQEILELIRVDPSTARLSSTEASAEEEVASPDSDRSAEWWTVRRDAIRFICSVFRLAFPIVSRRPLPSSTEATEDEDATEIERRAGVKKGLVESVMKLTMDGVERAENAETIQSPFRRLDDEEWYLILQMGELLLD
ncbi:hypothetical protein FRC05_010306 [Tulasnella sp. 425]|nr:hypothetical protein FRC05_010306 [Tulasnella sp. 425]